MTAKRTKRQEAALLDHVYDDSIAKARAGDRRTADLLLADFASLSTDPQSFAAVGGPPMKLIQYVAGCIADWRRRQYADAPTWFYVDRPAHAPTLEPGSKHVRAMVAYRLLLARGRGVSAAVEGASQSSGLTEGQVKSLTQRKDEEFEFAVMSCINKRLHKRVQNPPRKKYQRSR